MKTIIICGMPRSGTSWLGQIINSDPKVIFRTEPLFAYHFKNRVNPYSTCNEVEYFLDSLIDVDDEFILQKENHRLGYYPTFFKEMPEILAFKTTRHHELLEKYLSCLSDVHIIGIVRHPCAVINSWLKSFKEFQKKDCQKKKDWRTGGCRKSEVGEYWGFDDWLAITHKFIRLSEDYPNFHIIKYSDLVTATEKSVEEMMGKIGIEIHSQTFEFISNCHDRHDNDPYSVFKSKKVGDEWRNELDVDIAEIIFRDTDKASLSYFLT